MLIRQAYRDVVGGSVDDGGVSYERIVVTIGAARLGRAGIAHHGARAGGAANSDARARAAHYERR